MTSGACGPPIRHGARKGMSATGTAAGYERHRRAGEAPCGECRAADNEKRRRYYAANVDVARAKRREYAREHRAVMSARAKEWDAANPERRRKRGRENQARRRARILGTGSIPFTPEQLALRLSMWPGCWVCGGSPTEVDHVKPLAKGGAHMLANLRPICQHCNRTKHKRWPFEAAPHKEKASSAI